MQNQYQSSRFSLSCLLICISYCLFCSITQIVSADNPKQIFNISEVNEAALGKLFILPDLPDHPNLPTHSPVRTILENNSTLRSSFQRLASTFRFFDELIQERNVGDNPKKCNIQQDNDWVIVTSQLMQTRQIAEPSKECNFQLSSEVEIKARTFTSQFIHETRDVIVQGRHAMYNALSNIPHFNTLQRSDLQWQNGPFEIKDWALTRNNQTCTLDRVAAYVVNSSMYLIAEVTNHPVDTPVANESRQLVNEYISEDLLSSLYMIHPLYNTTSKGGKAGRLVNGTTLISRWSGTTSLASVGNMDFDENPAIQQAYQRSMFQSELAGDAVTISNIVTLTLPLMISLFPINLLVNLTTSATVAYMLLKGFCSTIPFLIKGIKLILMSSKKPDDLVVYRSGNMTVGVIEMFAASCRGESNFLGVGIIFMSVGVICMIAGVALEVTTHRIKVKRQKLGVESGDHRPFGLSSYAHKSEFTIEQKKYDEEDLYLKEQYKRYSKEISDNGNENDRDRKHKRRCAW